MMQETVHRIKVGRWQYEYRHVDLVVPVFALLLRLSLGFIFIGAGFDKLITDFTAKGFLINATSGPLKDLFVRLGENETALTVIDPLVVWGQILIGFSLILGLFTFYLAQLWPEFNPFLDEHIVYILVMALLGALGAGRILGLDALIERWQPVRRAAPLQYVLG